MNADDYRLAVHEGMRAYAIAPGTGGNRYLRNVAKRLEEVGFTLDPDKLVWIRPKEKNGIKQLIDVSTLLPTQREES